MRLAFSAVPVLLAVCACGNLSNEDVAFLEALPQKDHLQVKVPQTAARQSPCPLGNADIWINAKATGDSINSGVNGILGLMDAIRAVAPTTRDTDQRTWGPYPDKEHPGVEDRVTMFRELDATLTPWRWIYTIEARRPPGSFLPILEGEFFGAQATNGIGRMTLHFENSVALQINNPNDPVNPARVFYDLTGEPRTVSLDLTSGVGFGLARFDYGFAGYADGHGRFDYAFPDPKSGCTIEVTTWFTPLGAGRDAYRARCAPPTGLLVIGDILQCWDPSACLTYVNDPFAFTALCNAVKPCLLGNAATCPP
jgi:hypothetical protein